MSPWWSKAHPAMHQPRPSQWRSVSGTWCNWKEYGVVVGELEDAIRTAKERALAAAAAGPSCNYPMASEVHELCLEAVTSFRQRSRTPLPFYLLTSRDVFLPGHSSTARRIETIRTYQRLPAEGWAIRYDDPGDAVLNAICGVLCSDGRLMTDYDHVGRLPDLEATEAVSRPQGFWGPMHRLISRVVVDELPPGGRESEVITVRRWPAIRCTAHEYDHPRRPYGQFLTPDDFRNALIKTIGW
jgi:hypothetical protein